MDCPTEEQIIRNGLRGQKGIDKLDFDLLNRVLTVTHGLDDPTPIKKTLDGLDMAAQPLADGEVARGNVVPLWRWVTLGIGGALALGAEATAWILEARTGKHADTAPIVVGLALVALILTGQQIARKGLTALRTLTLNINFLMSVAILGAALTQQWPEAAMAAFLFALAETVEALSLERARNAIQTLVEATPVVALTQTEKGWEELPVASVALGAKVRVRPGEKVPLDGTLLEGEAVLSEAAITGESLPVVKEPGAAVYAGSVNAVGSFVFAVTATAGSTSLDRIVETVRVAQAERAPTQRFIDRFARVYTPTVVALAVAFALGAIALGTPWRDAVHRALVLLVIACPCALVVSTPVTLVSGLTAAARRGILVKGGAFLEAGRRLKVVAFDKTGTLTTGHPAVTDVIPLTSETPEELLHLAASLNASSEHPIAAAIVAHCRATHKNCALLPVEDFQALVGRGVAGTVAGVRHFLGSHRLVHENAVCGPHVESVLEKLEADGKSAAVLTSDREALAVLGVADRARAESREAIESLQKLGIATVLLTGDGAAAARAIGREVGIAEAEIRAELLPDDKSSAIDALRARFGSDAVGMVGDGINDGPALARSAVGMAMGRGTAAALEIADVALLRDDPRLVGEFVALSRRVGKTLNQNISIALGIKLVFFALALAGKATLWMAVFADMGASLIVVANGLRLLSGGPKAEHTHGPACEH